MLYQATTYPISEGGKSVRGPGPRKTVEPLQETAAAGSGWPARGRGGHAAPTHPRHEASASGVSHRVLPWRLHADPPPQQRGVCHHNRSAVTMVRAPCWNALLSRLASAYRTHRSVRQPPDSRMRPPCEGPHCSPVIASLCYARRTVPYSCSVRREREGARHGLCQGAMTCPIFFAWRTAAPLVSGLSARQAVALASELRHRRVPLPVRDCRGLACPGSLRHTLAIWRMKQVPQPREAHERQMGFP